MKSIARAVPASDGERSPAPARRLSVIVVFPWSTCAMMPMLRICSLLETIFRMSAELLKRGNESYLSNRRDSANPYSSLLYVTQGNPCHSSSFFVPTRMKVLIFLALGFAGSQFCVDWGGDTGSRFDRQDYLSLRL